MRGEAIGNLLGLGALFVLAACTSPIDVSTDYVAAPLSPRSGEPHVLGCKLAIADIADSRLDPATIGSLGPRVVHGPTDARAWLGNVLKSLSRYGVDVSLPPRDAAAGDELTASVTLVALWVASVTSAKTGAVLISVRYERNGAVVKRTNYRGTNSEPDWFGSSDEIQSMIDDAAGQVVKAMSDDLRSLCAHAEPQPPNLPETHDPV
jgi:uncharacterized lipoprotein YajG